MSARLAWAGALVLGSALLSAAGAQESKPGAPRSEAPAAIDATVASKDGTPIAFTRRGEGPAVILVAGALSDRSMAAPLAALLAPKFTVVNYDRRGRGRSGDAAAYSVEREVEDLAALIEDCGGEASLYGASSGAVLAIETAARRPAVVRRAVLYEPPFIVDATRTPVPEDFLDRVKKLIAEGRRGDAVETFMVEAVLVPKEAVAQMKKAPMWRGLEQLAHTLPYDGQILGSTLSGKPLPADRWAGATMPVLVVAGGRSEAWMRNASAALADVLPDAERRTLEGQDHAVAPAAIAPVLEEFLTAK